MTSAKKKGDDRERQVVKIIKEVFNRPLIQAQRTMKRIYTKQGIKFVSQANDFWGLFDGLYRDTNRKLIWYQVKSDISDVYKAKKDIMQWAIDNSHILFEECEVWKYEYRKGFKIWRYSVTNDKWSESFINFKGNIIPLDN